MPALEPRPTPRSLTISLAIAIISLVGAAWLGGEAHDTLAYRLLHDAAQVIGGLALAGAGIGAWIYVLQRIRWRRALQAIAVNRFDATLRHVGEIMWATTYVLFADAAVARQVNEAFQLPWSEASEAEVTKISAEAKHHAERLQTGPVSSRTEALVRLSEVSTDLSDNCDALWVTASEFEGYLNSSHTMPLLNRAADLQRHVRRLLDEGSERSREPDHGAAWLPVVSLDVFNHGTAVAIALRAPLSQLLRRLKDKQLRDEIAEQEVRVQISTAMAGLFRQMRGVKDEEARAAAAIQDLNSTTRRMRQRVEALANLDAETTKSSGDDTEGGGDRTEGGGDRTAGQEGEGAEGQ